MWDYAHSFSIFILSVSPKMSCFQKRFPCYKDRELRTAANLQCRFTPAYTLQQNAGSLQTVVRMAGLLMLASTQCSHFPSTCMYIAGFGIHLIDL